MKFTLWIDEQPTGPFDLCQITSMYQQGIITGETQALIEDGTWKPLRKLVPSLSSVVTTSELCSTLSRNIIAGLQPDGATGKSTTKSVSVTDVDMPFGSMVSFMVKWAIASIPAAILLAALGFSITLVFTGVLAGLKR
jgi:hypothetical protein